MKRNLFFAGVFATVFLWALVAAAQPATPPTLVTFYSVGKSSKLPFGGGPGTQPWWGFIWVDDHKITHQRFAGPHFLTIKLSEGDHSIAGETGGGHEAVADKTTISVHGGIRNFVRLASKSNGAPFAPQHHIVEQVPCQQAHSEAASLDPFKLKRVEKSWLDSVVPESYFPGCEK